MKAEKRSENRQTEESKRAGGVSMSGVEKMKTPALSDIASDANAVYRDGRFELGFAGDGSPTLTIEGKPYRLSCHPYEPCLHITGPDGTLTAVRNSFDPSVALRLLAEGRPLVSITGKEYDARDFCRMIEYAAGRGTIVIDEAERVFASGAIIKEEDSGLQSESSGASFAHGVPSPEGMEIIEDDPFFDLLAEYPGCEIEFFLVKSTAPYAGLASHKSALAAAARKIAAEEDAHFDFGQEIPVRQISPEELFAPSAGIGRELNYRSAFLDPPYPNGYTDADFERLNDALFPKGRDRLEIFDWTSESGGTWSDFFDDGAEWWGMLCFTVYDPRLDRFTVLMASSTD